VIPVASPQIISYDATTLSNYNKDHDNNASQKVKISGEGMKVEKDAFLIDDKKFAMMMMRQRPLADRSRLELWQPERHGCQQ